MGTTDTQSTVHVPLASNASSTPDAELRTLQEYCCALLNKSPYTRDGDVDGQLALYTTNQWGSLSTMEAYPSGLLWIDDINNRFTQVQRGWEHDTDCLQVLSRIRHIHCHIPYCVSPPLSPAHPILFCVPSGASAPRGSLSRPLV